MNSACAVVAYIPPLNEYPSAAVFLENIRKFKTKHPLILYSDGADFGPDVIRLKATPTIVKGAKHPNGHLNKFAVNNLCFLSGVQIARAHKADYILYVEADCRVRGDYWDQVVFDEFFKQNNEAVIGGSIVCYQPCNKDRAFATEWRRFLAKHANSKFIIPTYGGIGAAEQQEPAVFPNGALAIYKLSYIEEIFDLMYTVKSASDHTAFDYHAGRELVRKYGPDAFKYIVHLDSVYSGYGNVLFTEEERQQLLVHNEVCGVHQIKSPWTLDEENDQLGINPLKVESPPIPVALPANLTSEIECLPAQPPDPAVQQFIRDTNAAILGVGTQPTEPPKTPLEPSQAMEPAKYATQEVKTPPEANVSDLERVKAEARRMAKEETKLLMGNFPLEQRAKEVIEAVGKQIIQERLAEPKVTIFIVTYAPDAKWLTYCLRSIDKFATGFHNVIVVCPTTDLPVFNPITAQHPGVFLRSFDEAPGKGHLHHCAIKILAPTFDLEADYFLFLDSDVVFCEPVTPQDYFVDGKPVLLKQSYESLAKKPTDAPACCWQEGTSKALGFKVANEFMRRHPAVHSAVVLTKLVAYLEKIHGMKFIDWALAQKSDFPVGCNDFNTMGAYAHRFHWHNYHWIDVGEKPSLTPRSLLIQFWSKRELDQPQDVLIGGKVQKVIPLQVMKNLGL